MIGDGAAIVCLAVGGTAGLIIVAMAIVGAWPRKSRASFPSLGPVDQMTKSSTAPRAIYDLFECKVCGHLDDREFSYCPECGTVWKVDR